MTDTTVKDLFAAQAHIGHRPERWNPKMKPYLHSQRAGVWIFDLEQTAERLDAAKKFLKAIKMQNKKVLWVGTKPQIALEIQKQVLPTGQFYVDKKWTPGLLTNFEEIRRRVDHYLDLKNQFESGEVNKYTKKEVAGFKKQLDKLEACYGGVAEMREKPDVVVILDAVCNELTVKEAQCAGIGIIAVADANANPDGIDYLIPANDDSIKSIRYIVGELLQSLA